MKEQGGAALFNPTNARAQGAELAWPNRPVRFHRAARAARDGRSVRIGKVRAPGEGAQHQGQPDQDALIVPQYDVMDSVMTRRPTDPRAAAEAAFKAATTKPAELPPKPPSVRSGKELVSLRIDRDVLDYFQEEGPGWQERINAALRKAAGK